MKLKIALPKTRVISGFPGIGKSTIVKSKEGDFLDSDSSTFPKDAFPENYLNYIEDKVKNTNSVMLASSHQEVRQGLVDRGIDFTLIYPARELKDEYMQRYAERGSPQPFLDLMDSKWDEFIDGCEQQKGCNKIVLSEGQFLADVLGHDQRFLYKDLKEAAIISFDRSEICKEVEDATMSNLKAP